MEQPDGGFSEAVSSADDGKQGHRKRLKERFVAGGRVALLDYEVLELILFRTIPRRDTKPIAKRLLKEFGSIAEVFGAPEKRLEEISGIGPGTLTDLKLIKVVADELTSGDLRQRPLLSSWSSVLDYCRTTLAYEENEKFKIIFLDKKNRLIKDEIQGDGTVDHTPVYPRKVLKRALELSASALILVHNHPSGDPTPSNADITMTKKIVAALEQVDIVLHDHIIIARDGHTSLRGQHLI